MTYAGRMLESPYTRHTHYAGISVLEKAGGLAGRQAVSESVSQSGRQAGRQAGMQDCN